MNQPLKRPRGGSWAVDPKTCCLVISCAFIMGARTPFPLGPDTECMGDRSGGRWELVGPCSMYGLTYEEGLSMGGSLRDLS